MTAGTACNLWRFSGDYRDMTNDETNNETTDRDIERLLRGEEPAALADLAPGITTLRSLAIAPDGAHAARAGAVLAGVAASGNSPLAVPAASGSSRWRVRAAIAGGLALAGAGLVGGAAAADHAAPGDALYGLDRALEVVGVNDGGAAERIAEAISLDEAGDTEGALEHVAESLEGDEGSSAALLAAAELIRSNGSEASAEVHARVADMLEWMATTDATGRDFGQGVSERARGLHDEAEPTPGTEPEDTTVEDAPGRSGDTPATEGGLGKPEGAGEPTVDPAPNATLEDAEVPADAQVPEDAGVPSDAGKPEGAGRP